MYQTSFKQITNWVHRFEREGFEGLKDKPGRGRKPSLAADQMAGLSNLLLKTAPTDYGYNAVSWTGPLLIAWIREHYGIEFRKAQICNIIKKLGFSYQKARGIYPEADPELRGEFVEELKKTLQSPPDTVLLFEDELSLSNTATIGYSWSLSGKQPQVQTVQEGRERRTAMGSYNYQTGQITVSFSAKGNC